MIKHHWTLLVLLFFLVWISLTTLLSVFVSSVILFSTVQDVDLPRKLHWTPGEEVSGDFVFPDSPFIWSQKFSLRLFRHSLTTRVQCRLLFFPRATRLTSSARCQNGTWPSPSLASSSPTSGTSRYQSVSSRLFCCQQECSPVRFWRRLSLQKIKLRAEVDLQSTHLYEQPHGVVATPKYLHEASESSPLLAGGTWPAAGRSCQSSADVNFTGFYSSWGVFQTAFCAPKGQITSV